MQGTTRRKINCQFALNFVPIAKQTDEFRVKEDVEKFLHSVLFFHDKEDVFENLTFANRNGLPSRPVLIFRSF